MGMEAMKDRDARLTELFEAHASRLYAYARRHAGSDEAEDLVADAFAVALRRLDDVPSDDAEAFAWETVDEIPAGVRTTFQKSDNGERVYGASSTTP